MEYDNGISKQEMEPVSILPEVIDAPYPYISIQDLATMATILVPDLPSGTIGDLEDILQEIRMDMAPDNCTFYKVSTRYIGSKLEERCEYETSRTDSMVGVVHMDRHIGQSQQEGHFTRLEVSRNKDGQLTPRLGSTMQIEEQLHAIIQWASQRQLEEIILVDDVVAFGDTLPVIIEQLYHQGLPRDIRLRIFAGIAASGGVWNGIEKVLDTTGIEVEFITKVMASPKIPKGSLGMALPVSRDLTLLGGRVTTLENGQKYTHPYMLPFSKPLSSIIRSEYQIEASRRLLEFNRLLIDTLETHAGYTFYIKDLEDHDIGLPHTNLECLNGIMSPPDRDMSVLEYLDYALNILNANQDIIMNECSND